MTTRQFLVRATAAVGRRLTGLSQRLATEPPATAGSHPAARTLAGDREIEWPWTLAHARRTQGQVLDFGVVTPR